MKISVFGLGYVGCVSAACLAKDGHDVVGVDVNPRKVEAIGRGESTVQEEGVPDLVAEAVQLGHLRATTDEQHAIETTDLSLICVGTPGQRNGSIDRSHLEVVARAIGGALALRSKGSTPHTIVVRSTSIPGTLEELVIPALEDRTGLRSGIDYTACVNPEFLREGSSVRDYYNPPFTVIGSRDKATAQRVKSLYINMDAPVFQLEPREAEMVKYACNAFHGLKVSFANEIGNICKALGIDSHRVMDAFCADRKLNISAAYLTPGFAFGGSCLPKDIRALTHVSRTHDVETPVLNATLQTNRQQVERAARLVLDAGNRRIGVLGLSFKDGTDDLRESPTVGLVEILLGNGMEIRVYDKNVRESALVGANLDYIQASIPHIWKLMGESLEGVIRRSDTLVVSTNQPEVHQALAGLEGTEKTVVDLVRIPTASVPTGTDYVGICW